MTPTTLCSCGATSLHEASSHVIVCGGVEGALSKSFSNGNNLMAVEPLYQSPDKKLLVGAVLRVGPRFLALEALNRQGTELSPCAFSWLVGFLIPRRIFVASRRRLLPLPLALVAFDNVPTRRGLPPDRPPPWLGRIASRPYLPRSLSDPYSWLPYPHRKTHPRGGNRQLPGCIGA